MTTSEFEAYQAEQSQFLANQTAAQEAARKRESVLASLAAAAGLEMDEVKEALG